MPEISTQCSTSSREWWFRGAIRAVVAAWRVRRERKRAAHILTGLSDRMLIDMGISRCEAHGLVYGCSADRRRYEDEAAS